MRLGWGDEDSDKEHGDVVASIIIRSEAPILPARLGAVGLSSIPDDCPKAYVTDLPSLPRELRSFPINLSQVCMCSASSIST